jgi:transcriptional regulator with XRE-family HTH domain
MTNRESEQMMETRCATFAAREADAGGSPDTTAVSRAVGEKVRLMRLKGEMTQAQLADRTRNIATHNPHFAGCAPLSRVGIVAIEAGNRPIRIDEVVLLAEALDTTVVRLMKGAPGERVLEPKPDNRPWAALLTESDTETRARLDRLDMMVKVLQDRISESDSRWRALTGVLKESSNA